MKFVLVYYAETETSGYSGINYSFYRREVELVRIPENRFVDGFRLTLSTTDKKRIVSSHISKEVINDDRFLDNEFRFLKKKD